MKKKRRLRPWVKVLFAFIPVAIIIVLLININNNIKRINIESSNEEFFYCQKLRGE